MTEVRQYIVRIKSTYLNVVRVTNVNKKARIFLDYNFEIPRQEFVSFSKVTRNIQSTIDSDVNTRLLYLS